MNLVFITLHVNGGTFFTIKAKKIFDHNIHTEFGTISNESAKAINRYKKNGGKVIAVGTTVLRLLESAKDNKGMIKEFEGETDIF